MTKLRNRPKFDFFMLVVKPVGEFTPSDWRDKPSQYEVLGIEGTENFRGRVDAWRFLYNRSQMKETKINRWAIVCGRLESFSPSGNSRKIDDRLLSRQALNSDQYLNRSTVQV